MYYLWNYLYVNSKSMNCTISLKTLLFVPGAHQLVEEGGVDRVQELFIQSRSQRNMFALSDKPFCPSASEFLSVAVRFRINLVKET